MEYLNSNLKTKHLRRKEILLKKGEICNNIYFIEKGLLRCYYEKNDEEISSWFMKENDVIISVKSFYNRTPSYETIAAIENTIVHGITYMQLEFLYKNYLEFNIIGRLLTTKYYILSEERIYSLRKERARDRYLSLLKTRPDIIKRVPLKYIASYLGITLETLSRIRSGIS